ncbi:MAG TPA: hypothetical protein VFB49_05880 [Patescibacteria group bacterium]|nr:hypothetical protein [Patescibacteria group bacterium]
MALFVGVALALLIGLFASVVGLDRDRAFYPTLMIVIAFYYALFALMGGSLKALAAESVPIAVFVGASIAGFKGSLWLVAAALAAHGVFDLVHARMITNPGVPAWWPPFCFAYDVVAAGYLAWLLRRSRIRAQEASS